MKGEFSSYSLGKEAFRTREQAMERAEKMRLKKIASLKKQIESGKKNEEYWEHNSYYFIFARRKTGSFNIRDIDGENQKDVTYKKLKLSRCKRFMVQKEMN